MAPSKLLIAITLSCLYVLSSIYWYHQGGLKVAASVNKTTVDSLVKDLDDQSTKASQAVERSNQVAIKVTQLMDEKEDNVVKIRELSKEANRSSECDLTAGELFYYQTLIDSTRSAQKP